MKKFLPITVVVILLLSPMYAMAGIMGTAWLKTISYVDYDYHGQIEFPAVGTPGPFVPIEMFCVEGAAATISSKLYTILSIDASLEGFGLSALNYKKSAWRRICAEILCKN